ncbi:MAG TPA: M56 family metallopeptidase [Candidatus Acidoferrales bacterium]|nr:M56 family metallopeptidase [Candidatus Acidoferrales bacterium]
MIAPYLMRLYLLRLLCLSLASFFLVHATLSLSTWLATPAAIRLAKRLRPRLAARFLLALRLLPAGAALFVVAGLCVPSYLWLEPATKPELVGFACWAAALLGTGVWGISIARGLRAVCGSLQYYRRCERAGREARLPSGGGSPLLVVEGEAPLVALAGVLRSRIVISRGVLRALSPVELDAVLRHERAHRASGDNFKRLLLVLAPDIFPFSRGSAALDRAWARFSEWAADDRAVGGDSRRSLSLAAALVRVARMGAPRREWLLSCLLADGADLSARVDRLLLGDCLQEKPAWAMRALAGTIAIVATGMLMAAILQPATLYWVHRLLEHLIR